MENFNLPETKNAGDQKNITRKKKEKPTYISSLEACDVKPLIRYFLRIFPRCVTSTFTPLRAFLICKRDQKE